jgi:RHS repeat-associated protein
MVTRACSFEIVCHTKMLGGVFFERVVGPSATTWNEYLFAGGEMIGVHFTAATAPAEPFLYFVKDHLGSIAVIVNGAGVVHERLAYDAWGKRRHPNGTDDAANILTASATRGFTGHEMIDEMDLVNMNGRVYDPALGRFLSADPFIHDVTNSQDLNRYSYVHNNPLSYTDMNGYGFFKSLGKFFKKILKPLIALAVALTLQFELLPALLPGLAGAEAGGFALGKAVIAGLSGGVGNVILSGRPKAFLSGFGQAFLTYGVGHGLFPGRAARFIGDPKAGTVAFGSGQHLGRVIGHGVIGGSFAEIHGGKFSAGFSSAAFTAAAGPILPEDFWGGFAAGTAIGCGGSVLGGGKCGEGAVTAAFVYLFNEYGGRCTAAKAATAATCGAAAATAVACATTTAGVVVCGPVVAVGGLACVAAAAATYACENLVYNEGEESTEHGKTRAKDRGISQDEIEEAIETAKETGQVTTQTGKYGTPQKVYTGTNGVTVVVETEGRNAGKVITTWRN